MIVLHKVIRQAVRLELILSKCLHEKAAAVLKNIRHEYDHVSQMSRFNFDFHYALHPLFVVHHLQPHCARTNRRNL